MIDIYQSISKLRRGETSSPLGADVSEACGRRHSFLPLSFFTHHASGVGQGQQTLQLWIDSILQATTKIIDGEPKVKTHTSLCHCSQSLPEFSTESSSSAVPLVWAGGHWPVTGGSAGPRGRRATTVRPVVSMSDCGIDWGLTVCDGQQLGIKKLLDQTGLLYLLPQALRPAFCYWLPQKLLNDIVI